MDFKKFRERMVTKQVEARGVRQSQLLAAMREVPREAFVSQDLREFAYEDSPLPIGLGQTISQPYIVAHMIETAQIEPGQKVLEVGAGSGYAAAVISRIPAEVYTIERHPELAKAAGQRLALLGYHNVRVLEGDGTRGWPAFAPYDAILVAAGGPEVPEALLQQLKIGGRLIIPVGENQRVQRLTRIVRYSDHSFRESVLGPVQFVPLIGVEGWPDKADGFARPPH